MQKRHFIAILCLLLAYIAPALAQKNTLAIPDVTVAQGKSVSLPISMENTADIVAVQFTITTADGITLTPSSAKLTERADGHTITMRSKGNNQYMVMMFSSQNHAFIGRTGNIMSVLLDASASLEEGSKQPITLSDVVIADKTGRNLATGLTSGSVTIAKSPDLEVSHVTTTAKSIDPQGKLSVSWQVSNVGGQSTENGWREHVYLTSEDGNTQKFLGSIDYDKKLAAGGSISRTAEFDIPALLGISSQAKLTVKVKPYSDTGEPSWLQANNEASTNALLKVSNLLFVTPSQANIEEANAQNVRFQLSRSGNTEKSETFSLTSTTDERLQLPSEITIPQGQSGTYFYAKVTPNGILDSQNLITLDIKGDGYTKATASITVQDDTNPKLTLTAKQQDVTEGGKLDLTIEAERAATEDKEVQLSCDLPTRFKIPSGITLKKGETKVEVTVEALEDDIPDVEKVVTFAVSADGYQTATLLSTLVDDDMPNLEMQLTPSAVSEADGPLAVSGILRRTNNIDKKVTIRLSDDSNGGIYYARQTIEMAAGEKEAVINLGPIDNNIVDGERTYQITAAVYIASCSCNAGVGTSGGNVTVPLTVYDNDGPTLNLTSSSSLLKEGGEMSITLSRNTESKGDLKVNISSNQDGAIEYPKTVTIPDGKASATFTVKSKSNDITGDDLTAMITAESDGYAKSSVWFTISDQTLPDARITDISSDKEQAEAGENVAITMTISNVGNHPLPEQTKIGLYIDNASTASAIAYLQEDLEAGKSTTLTQNVTLPSSIGIHKVYAVANDGMNVKELLYTNNTSTIVNIQTVSPFSMTAKTDKSVYQQGDKITISGKATGKNVAQKDIEIYVINQGYRHTISAQTEADGSFKVSYEPYKGQMGHFSVGACYPTENLITEMAGFDIYGMQLTRTSAITCEATLGDNYDGKLSFRNPGSLSLTGIKAKVTSQPKDCNVTLSTIQTLKGGEEAELAFTITPKDVSQGTDWEKINLSIESAEGAKLTTTLYYYCRNKEGKIEASVARINTTMVKGDSRDYPFTITNVGKGETGKISLALPSWMTSVTPQQLPSLAKDESTDIILRMTPTEKMQLNVPVTGSIGINCANGEGLSLPFYIEPVSTTEGTLTIDVCDENTYYTKEAPHLAEAQVTITHPTTGKMIAEGKTNSKGIYSVSLPEGYYAVNVTAEKHDSYRNNLLVDPGKDNKTTVNLSISAIKISYDVVETEVEDRYEIVTTTKYETNVPRPVVVASAPKITNGDNMKEGESIIINYVLANKGLINAENVRVTLPTSVVGWEFKALESMDEVTLAPQSSKVYPIQITRVSTELASGARANNQIQRVNSNSPMAACMAGMENQYKWRCGKDMKEDESLYHMALKTCANSAIMEAISSSIAGSIGGGSGTGGGGGGSYGPSGKPSSGNKEYETTEKEQVISTYDPLCDPNRTKCGEALINKLLGKLPGVGPILDKINDAADKAIEAAEKGGKLPASDIAEMAMDIAEEAKDALDSGKDAMDDLEGMADELEEILDACSDFLIDQSQREARATRTGVRIRYSVVHVINLMISELRKLNDVMVSFYGHRVWYARYNTDKARFFNYLGTLNNFDNINESEMLEHKPSDVTKEQCYILIEHLKKYLMNDVNAWKETKDELAPYLEHEQNAKELGYESFDDLYKAKLKEAYEEVTESSSSVCSSITLQFTQQMVMTRQAFRGTLTVFNGHETEAMKNVTLNLTITDEKGNLAMSDKFQTNLEKLDGFNGNLNFNSGWTLDAQQTGVANVLFIPTKHAAPTVETRYAFGGSITYTDPYTGLEVTRQLSPITLTVKPAPSLDLTYFMQRDILGDDPLTKEVEPSVEAEFSLLINNVGNGDANNVMMTTNQPEIIANEKGLHINFELMSSQLNGQDKNLALGGSVATDFGNIPAKSTAYAQWWIKSSLLGHFTDYDVNATHLSSYGNKDLSLLNEVTIHELIRSIDIEKADKQLKGFMSNDIADANDTPDMLYLSDGEIEKVNEAETANIVKTSATEYKLTVTPSVEGWNYGNITDPTYGVSALKSVRRESDGKTISLRNIWQTDRTLRDGKDPLYENRIHFVDEFGSKQAESYVLTFEPTPELLLEVASIEGTPAEGEIAFQPVEKVNVMFNKHIDPATFTADDIQLAIQGKEQDGKKIQISTEDNKTFTLDLTAINETADNGYYTLTIQTADITDYEGYKGKTGKTADWIMYKDGQVKFLTATYPQGAGDVEYTITPNETKKSRALTLEVPDGKAQYGSTILLTAKPKDGYIFESWSLNGEMISTEPTIEQTALTDLDYVANFTKKTYQVTIDEDCVGGSIINSHTGIYEHGEELELVAEPAHNFRFDHWIINGTPSDVNDKDDEGNGKLIIIVDRDYTVSATFEAATGINAIFAEDKKLRIYSVEGFLIDAQGTVETLKRLPKGIYIVNGIKYVVK